MRDGQLRGRGEERALRATINKNTAVCPSNGPRREKWGKKKEVQQKQERKWKGGGKGTRAPPRVDVAVLTSSAATSSMTSVSWCAADTFDSTPMKTCVWSSRAAV